MNQESLRDKSQAVKIESSKNGNNICLMFYYKDVKEKVLEFKKEIAANKELLEKYDNTFGWWFEE